MIQGLVTTARVVSKLFTGHWDATLEAQWGVEWARKSAERDAIAEPAETPPLSWLSMIIMFIIYFFPTLVYITFKARGMFRYRTELF